MDLDMISSELWWTV